MKFFKSKSSRMSILLVLVWAGMFFLSIPSFGTNEVVETEGPASDTPSQNTGDGSTKEPIDTASGNNYFTESRIFVPCPGVPLAVDLKYQSITGNPEGKLGKGWVHSYEWSLDIQSGQAVLYTGSGEKKVFAEDGSGGYLSPDGKNWTLEQTTSGYEVEMPGGLVYTFDSSNSNRLDLVQDAWGNWVECAYGTNGCLETATHSNGRQILFSNVWNVALGEWRISSIEVQGGESLAFAYDGGQFTQVVERVGTASYTSRYQYADGYLTNKVNGAGFEYSFGYANVGGTLNGKGNSLDVDGYYDHSLVYEKNDSVSETYANVTYSRARGDQVFRYVRNNGSLTEKYGPADSVKNVQQRGIRYTYATAKGFDKTKEEQFDNTAGESFTEWKLYDDAHNMTNYAVSYCTTVPVQQFSMEYDPVWQLPSIVTDAEGHRTETTYTNGLPLIVKAFHDASNSYDTTFAYTTNGLPLAITNANGHVVSFSYDAMDNLATTSAEVGSIVTNTYDALGFVKSMEILSESGNSTGRITQYNRDAKGQILQTIFADGLTASASYNALGYLTNSVDRAGRATDYTYAPTEKLTSVTRYLQQGSSNVPVRIDYDLDKQVNVLRITEPRGRYVESYQLDIQDRVVAVTNIENQVLSIDYGVGDFIWQAIRFDGSSITNTYDSAGQKESTTYRTAGGSPAATISYSYYPDGEIKTIADDSSSVSNSYDRLNRLTNQVVQASNLQSEIDHAFDPVGNVTNSVVSVGTHSIATAHSFDAAERPTGISTTGDTETQSFAYGYSPINGRISSVTNSESAIVCTYEFDLMDRTTNITYRAFDGSLIRSLEYAYNTSSMITEKKIVDVGSNLSSFVRHNYVYDSLDRLVHESKTSSVGNSMFDIGYSYDLAGNRTSKISNGWETTYLHTNGNRLASSTSAQAATNTLFVSGLADELIGTDNRWGELWLTNLTSGATVIPNINGNTFFATIPATSGQTNSLHVAIRDRAGNMGYATKDFFVGTASGTPETKTYEYDSAGNTTNLNGVSLDWDERYRLKNVDMIAPADSNLTCSVEYEYDVLNRRTSRICTAGGSPAETNRFVYDNNQVVADLDGSGNLLRTYTWGTGIDNLLAMTVYGATATNTYYAIKDHQNTVIALTDSTGSVVETYEYDAWGNTRVLDASGSELTASALENRYTFQGREIDWNTGLYYFRARWYNPETGHWISKDPIGVAGGLNLYAFCGNNPVNFTDPLGLINYGKAAGSAAEMADQGNPFSYTSSLSPQANALNNALNQRQNAENAYPEGTDVLIDPTKPPGTVPPVVPPGGVLISGRKNEMPWDVRYIYRTKKKENNDDDDDDGDPCME